MEDGSERKNKGGGNGFKALGLSDRVYRGIVRLGFRTPTPVQRKAVPVIMTGVDTVVMARTGSGKTCAFLIPLLEKLLVTPPGVHGNHVRAIILSPTRELSMQTLKVLHKLVSGGGNDETTDTTTIIRAIGIHGAESMEKQFHLLASKPNIICATPGRLAHHLTEIPDFHLHGCVMCVLDEADRLFEMGFMLQIRQIAQTLPECQKVLLSATMPKQLIEFTQSGFAVDPTVVRLDQEVSVSPDLRIAFITCRSSDKDAALLHILQHIQQQQDDSKNKVNTGLVLIFAATRHHVEYISTLLTASGMAVTFIYGSLDQQARQANLAAFKSGKKPVLVVTDVAARGIDVPLIDHVIHYHLPTPKLFVHRSGRAARAGRIGYCWGLVEPDEMPYMMDLHLFLGRKPSTDEETYTLHEMTPDMVHYGSLPEAALTEQVENVQRIMNSELSSSLDAQALRSLTKVCHNAMKQYRKTRTEASRQAVQKAKAILEGKRLATGQRIGGGSIPTHPLLRGMEHSRQARLDQETGGIASLENVQKRQDFLCAVSNFRPKETVFETFATKGGKDVGIVSHLDKGRTTKNKKHDSSVALTAMKNMRRQMRMVRDKGTALVVAGSANALEVHGDDADASHVAEALDVEQQEEPTPMPTAAPPERKAAPESKRRLSKAERRRLKKDPDAVIDRPSQQTTPKKIKRGTDFRDPAFFISNDLTSSLEESQRSRHVEAALQPMASARGSMGKALRIEEAMLDIVGDENEELVKKQRMMRWDKSKRKYVQTTVGDELSGDSKSKKMRLESGQLMKNDKVKLGDLYAKWQKKTNMSVGRGGVFDDTDAAVPMASGVVKKGKSKALRGGGRDELKTPADIKKERERKQNLKMKNMKKTDRRVLERKQRERRNEQERKTMKATPRKRK